jgi:hypothetical protein
MKKISYSNRAYKVALENIEETKSESISNDLSQLQECFSLLIVDVLQALSANLSTNIRESSFKDLLLA